MWKLAVLVLLRWIWLSIRLSSRSTPDASSTRGNDGKGNFTKLLAGFDTGYRERSVRYHRVLNGRMCAKFAHSWIVGVDIVHYLYIGALLHSTLWINWPAHGIRGEFLNHDGDFALNSRTWNDKLMRKVSPIEDGWWEIGLWSLWAIGTASDFLTEIQVRNWRKIEIAKLPISKGLVTAPWRLQSTNEVFLPWFDFGSNNWAWIQIKGKLFRKRPSNGNLNDFASNGSIEHFLFGSRWNSNTLHVKSMSWEADSAQKSATSQILDVTTIRHFFWDFPVDVTQIHCKPNWIIG